MRQGMRFLAFAGTTLAVLLGLFLALALVLPVGEARIHAGLMALPCMWAARLILAHRRGRITKRLLFLATPGIDTSLSLTNPSVLDRDSQRWEFSSYFLRECAVCAFAWIFLLANMVLPAVAESVRL